MKYTYNAEDNLLNVDAGKVSLNLYFSNGDFSHLSINNDQEFLITDDAMQGIFVCVDGKIKNVYVLVLQAISDYDDVVEEYEHELAEDCAHSDFIASPFLTNKV